MTSNPNYRLRVRKPSPPGPLSHWERGSRASDGVRAGDRSLLTAWLAGLALALLLGLAAGFGPALAAGEEEPPAAGPSFIEQPPAYPLATAPAAYAWHTFYGSGSNYDIARAIAVDGSGGVYVAGFSTAAWIGPEDQAPLTAFTGGYQTGDMVVVKLDSAGAYRWHTFYGGIDSDLGFAIAADGSGGIYLAGVSYEPWTGPEGQAPLNAFSGVGDMVVVKLDSAGAYQWHTFYGSSSGYDIGGAIAVDGSGGIYLAGTSYAAWTGPEGQIPLNAFAGSDDIVVLRLNSAGAYQWHTFYGSSGYDGSNAIAVDGSGGVYLAGNSYALWTGPEDQAPLNVFAAEYGTGDTVVVKLDSAGAYQWHTFYGTDHARGLAIAVDGTGSVYVTSHSDDTWNGPGGQAPLKAFTGWYGDIVVIKLDSAGAYRWHTFYGSSGYDIGSAIAVDGSGGVYVTGYSYDTWTGPEGQAPLNAFATSDDTMVLRLNSDGAYRWHTFYGGSGYDIGGAIAVDVSGGVYLAGTSNAAWTRLSGQAPRNAFAGAVDITVVKTVSTAPEMTVLGNGVEIAAGSATPSPTNHTDFGSLPLGEAVTRTFTISNSGTADLNLTASPPVSITGPAAGDFSVVSQPTTPVAANGTTTFQVSFVPSVTGTRAAIVTIASDDDDENPYDFAIEGTGVATTLIPVYGSTPPAGSSIGLGRAAVGRTVTASLIISNTGSGTLVVTASLAGEHAAEFSVSPAGLTIPAGGPAQSLTLTCTPAGSGVRTASLAVAHNAAGSPAVYSLACAGGYVYLPVILR